MRASPKPAVAAVVSEVTVLTAVRTVFDRDGRATVRSVADEARMPYETTHGVLRRLADRGDVVWDGRPGTLRPADHDPNHPLRPIWDLCRQWDREVNEQ